MRCIGVGPEIVASRFRAEHGPWSPHSAVWKGRTFRAIWFESFKFMTSYEKNAANYSFTFKIVAFTCRNEGMHSKKDHLTTNAVWTYPTFHFVFQTRFSFPLHFVLYRSMKISHHRPVVYCLWERSFPIPSWHFVRHIISRKTFEDLPKKLNV